MFERMYCYFINSLMCLRYRKFAIKVETPHSLEKIQREVLLQILKKNEACAFGEKYQFKEIRTIEDYQKKVPLSVYEDYEEALEKIKTLGQNDLFCEPLLLLEITSGSTSASKLIPYNQSLKAEFQKGIKPWLYDLYTGYKGLKWGKSYWSITPATAQKVFTQSGIPIGFEADSAYFGKLEQMLQKGLFAVPESVAQLSDMEAFYFETAYYLLICEHLTLISIWNPTYMLLILDYMERNQEHLVDRISKKYKKRGQQVERILKEKAYDQLWKNLKVISCWCDAHAKPYAQKLQVLFPKVILQPKGLLATEGFISFPVKGEKGARLSSYSHFFEFEDLQDQRIYLSHQLEKERQYTVILTTSGGLYRYQLKDSIQVVGFSGGIPLLEFIGKSDKVSDLFGEKLNEGFIKNVLEKFELDTKFCMMAPQEDHYVLYLQSEIIPEAFEAALRENFHYDYCRKLGQLKALEIFVLTGNPEKEYMEACTARGQRLGDIKPTLLYLHSGLDQFFKGYYI